MKIKSMTNCILCLIIFTNIIYSCNKENETQTGNVIFWKFTDALNCGPIEVNIKINSKPIGTINEDFLPYDSIPICGAKNCLTINYPIGRYNFRTECYCGINRTFVGHWTGTFEVKQDSCTKVFFDIKKITMEP